MAKFGDRIKETTDSTGTGTVDLNGAPTGFNPFSAAFNSADDAISYLIVDDPDSPTDWEVGKGTFTTGTPNTFARNTVEKSSNSDALVSFSAGTKTVIATPTATDLLAVFGDGVWGLKSAKVRAITASGSQVAADDGKLITADASALSPATLIYTLLAEATAGDGFAVTVRNIGASGTVDIDDDAAALVITLQPGEAAELRCDATTWHLVGDYDHRTAGDWALKSALVRAITASGSQVAADDGKLITADASALSPATLIYTLLAEATAGDGFSVTVKNIGASGTVDIDDDAAALIVTLQPGETAELRCNGTTWYLWASASGLPTPDFESSEQTVTFSSVLDVAHSFSALPKLVQVWLRCNTAQFGYVSGDEVLVPNANSSGAGGQATMAVQMDTTNVSIVLGAGLEICRDDTLAAGGITAANWKFIVRAWS